MQLIFAPMTLMATILIDPLDKNVDETLTAMVSTDVYI